MSRARAAGASSGCLGVPLRVLKQERSVPMGTSGNTEGEDGESSAGEVGGAAAAEACASRSALSARVRPLLSAARSRSDTSRANLSAASCSSAILSPPSVVRGRDAARARAPRFSARIARCALGSDSISACAMLSGCSSRLASSPAREARRLRRARSAASPRAAAADDLCRDKVAERKDLKGESDTLCTVVFKGADGKGLSVQVPTVRPAGVQGTAAAAHPLAAGHVPAGRG